MTRRASAAKSAKWLHTLMRGFFEWPCRRRHIHIRNSNLANRKGTPSCCTRGRGNGNRCSRVCSESARRWGKKRGEWERERKSARLDDRQMYACLRARGSKKWCQFLGKQRGISHPRHCVRLDEAGAMRKYWPFGGNFSRESSGVEPLFFSEYRSNENYDFTRLAREWLRNEFYYKRSGILIGVA